jgi:hypothetical protein
MILYSLLSSHPDRNFVNVFITAILLYGLWYALIPEEYRFMVIIATIVIDLYFYHFQLGKTASTPKKKNKANKSKTNKNKTVSFNPQDSYYYYPPAQNMPGTATGYMGSYQPPMMPPMMPPMPPIIPGGVDNRHLLNDIQSNSSNEADQVSVSSSSDSSYSTRSDT